LDSHCEENFFDNTQWVGLPFRAGAFGLYSNLDLLAQAGFPTNRGPKTITEMDQWCLELAVLNPDGTFERVGFFPRGIPTVYDRVVQADVWNVHMAPLFIEMNQNVTRENVAPAVALAEIKPIFDAYLKQQ
jgi:hypothetical protein